ncbi:MAG: hypothetical protein H8Z69_00835 [Nanohaloarchaea archaeon]|nr:hypothetical protein [Candidatus Nanohaloarchaea archaeon]
MRSEIEINSSQPSNLVRVLEKSLTSDNKVNYVINGEEGRLKIEVETDGLGPLRGCTDTVFRLSSLSKKILEV